MGGTHGSGRQRGIRKAQENGKAATNSSIVFLGAVGGRGRRQNTQKVIGSRARTITEDAAEEAIVFGALEYKLPLDECIEAERGAEHDEALLVLRKRPIAHPDRRLGARLQLGDARRPRRQRSTPAFCRR